MAKAGGRCAPPCAESVFHSLRMVPVIGPAEDSVQGQFFRAERARRLGSGGSAGFIRQDRARAVELPDESGVPVATRECTVRAWLV